MTADQATVGTVPDVGYQIVRQSNGGSGVVVGACVGGVSDAMTKDLEMWAVMAEQLNVSWLAVTGFYTS